MLSYIMKSLCFFPVIDFVKYCRNENAKLPVPSDILSMFGGQDQPSVQDDPALHEGRIRSFAHERGNWASLIYILRMHASLLYYLSLCLFRLKCFCGIQLNNSECLGF